MSILPLFMLAAEPTMAGVTPSTQTDAISEQDSAHPKYKDCAPPENFSARFPKTTLDQAVKSSLGYLTYAKPGPLERNNPVLGAGADSNGVYVKKFLGVPVYGYDHTYASVQKTLEGKETYSVIASSTNYSSFTKNTIFNQLGEIFIKRGNSFVSFKLTSQDENGWCGYQGAGKPPSCFSTGTAIFQVDKSLFEELAQADPGKPLMIAAKLHSGNSSKCPLYFSPLSFKAPLLKIDEQLAKAAAKQKRQLAKKE